MTPDKAIFTSALLTVGSTTAAHVLPPDKGGTSTLPTPKLLFGAAFTFIGLSILGDIAPQVAIGLSAAIALTAMTHYGVPILDHYFAEPSQPTKR